jgi:hypothetical protein
MTCDALLAQSGAQNCIAVSKTACPGPAIAYCDNLNDIHEKETSVSQSGDQATTGLAKILDPVAQCFTPEVAKRVVELRADPAVQARIEELAEKSNEGIITPEEMAEYDAYIQAMDIVAVLQKKASTLIVPPHAS